MCDECMAVHMARQGGDVRPTCPCGGGDALSFSTVPDFLWDVWMPRTATQVQSSAEHAPTLHDVVAGVCDALTIRRCPTCRAPFADFDGCAALSCPRCDQSFCGLCCAPCASSDAAHDHVRTCPLNSSDTYWVPSAQLSEVRSAQFLRGLHTEVTRVAREDGVLFAFLLLCRVWRAHPAHFTVDALRHGVFRVVAGR